jgi:hypothetical protein
VTKSKVGVLLLACLSIMTVVLMAIPMAASATVEYTNWSEAVFEGTDTFYGTGVVAYAAGGTAKLECRVLNDAGYDVVVKSAKINFDFGSYDATVPTSFPVIVKNNDRIVVRFEFTVPDDATNQVLHAYNVVIVYEKQEGPTTVNRVNWEWASDLNLDHDGWISGTLTLYDVTATAVNVIDAANYNEPDWLGVFTWKGGYAPSGTVYAKYDYTVQLAAGDGVNKVFYVTLLAGTSIDTTSVKICMVDKSTATTKQGAPLTSGYSVTAEGKVTFDTAPEAWKTPAIFYKYGNVWTNSGTNLAVYSADQADAQALAAQWTNMNAASVPPVFWLPLTTTAGAQPLSDSKVLAAQAATKYAAGDFAGAKADYQSAVDGLNTAYTANAALNTTAETGLASLLTNAGGAVDSYGAKLDAEAGKAHLIGVFYIMLGVALLIASLGSILWAYSLLVVARGPRQL